MIQRIQSLFLLGVVLISGLLLVVPVYELQQVAVPDVPSLAVSPATSFLISSNALLMILNCAIGVFALLAIFLYRNRSLQIRICNLDLLLTCVLVGLLFFVADTMSSNMNQHVKYLFGSYMPLIQLLFIFLASRFIKRDEDLVRSADRLR